MYTNNINNRQAIPSFGKFIKIKGHTKAIAAYKEELRLKNDVFGAIAQQKNNGNTVLYLFSGKHLDKFLDLMRKVYFRDLRTNPEKYLKSKPKELTLQQAKSINNIFKAKI